MLYSCVAIVGAAGYIPQIIQLLKVKTQAKSLSLITWSIWLTTWIISFSYGLFYLHDTRFCIVALVNIIGHLAVMGLVLYRRKQHLRTEKGMGISYYI